MHIQAEIRAEIGRRKMKISDLSSMTGISEATLWRKLQAETSPFNYEELCNISKAFDLPLSNLVARAEQKEKESQ